MEDIQREFEAEIRFRKNLARQARYVRNGSKSKKCSLSSDHMSEKKWKERNGKVMSYAIGTPVSWKEFKEYPIHIQNEYLLNLQRRYSMTQKDLADMLGVSPCTVMRLIKNPEIKVSFDRGHVMNDMQRERWKDFLSGSGSKEIESAPTTGDNVLPDLPVVPSPEIPPTPKTHMSGFSLAYDGEIDITEIANSIRFMIGDKAVGRLKIAFEYDDGGDK